MLFLLLLAVSRPPQDAFVLQESSSTTGSTDAEIQTYFGSGSLTHIKPIRNTRFIADTKWLSNNTANIVAELPHDLTVGSLVKINNVKSANNTLGAGNSGFNGIFSVVGISGALAFTIGVSTNPGQFKVIP